jgi:hypothetical protein
MPEGSRAVSGAFMGTGPELCSILDIDFGEKEFSEVRPVSKRSHLAVLGSQCSGIGI